MFARKRRKKWPIVLAVLLLLLAFLCAAAYYVGSTLELELRINGEEKETLEYGSGYADDGVQVVLKSGLFQDVLLSIPVTVTGQVDQMVTGAYALAYHAKLLWMEDTALRILEVVDTKPPVITLTDDSDGFTLPGTDYREPGFSAYDDYDGDLTHLVTWSIKENVITYVVSDSSGNYAIAQRTVNFTDPIAPELTLSGDQTVTVYLGREYTEPGYCALDNFDGDITDRVRVEGSVDVHTLGTYPILYTVTDTFGNTAALERTVTVVPVPQPEVVIPEGKVIYLTFDDGPSRHTPRLLEVLKKYDIKATFFVVKNQYAGTISQIAAQGHSVGVHTASHVYEEIYASEEAYFGDFQTIHDLIYEMSGVKSTLMRFPGGSSNRISSNYNPGIMTRLTKLVKDYGLQYFDWNVNSMDAGGAKTAEQVFRNVVNGISGNTCSVVLQHDIHGFSVDAVERIIQWGLANGYTFLPLTPNSPGCHQSIVN